MRLITWLVFVMALYTGLVALVRFLPAAERPLGFLAAAIVFYAVTLAVPAILGRK
jgi:hypothetical protein